MNNSKEKILIVDDNPPNIQLLGNILKDRYIVSFAMNGKDALKLIDSSDFDLILLDIMMPEMDGFEVCQILRASPKTYDLPIIFLSAKSDKKAVLKGLEIGANDYIIKPINAENVLDRINRQFVLRQNKTKQNEQTSNSMYNDSLKTTKENKEMYIGIAQSSFWYSMQNLYIKENLIKQIDKLESSSTEILAFQTQVKKLSEELNLSIKTRDGKRITACSLALNKALEHYDSRSFLKELSGLQKACSRIGKEGNLPNINEKDFVQINIEEEIKEVITNLPQSGPGAVEIKLRTEDPLSATLPKSVFDLFIEGLFFEIYNLIHLMNLPYAETHIGIILKYEDEIKTVKFQVINNEMNFSIQNKITALVNDQMSLFSTKKIFSDRELQIPLNLNIDKVHGFEIELKIL